jgi:hypothetical protein
MTLVNRHGELKGAQELRTGLNDDEVHAADLLARAFCCIAWTGSCLIRDRQGSLSRIHAVEFAILGNSVALRWSPSSSARAFFSARAEVISAGDIWKVG